MWWWRVWGKGKDWHDSRFRGSWRNDVAINWERKYRRRGKPAKAKLFFNASGSAIWHAGSRGVLLGLRERAAAGSPGSSEARLPPGCPEAGPSPAAKDARPRGSFCGVTPCGPAQDLLRAVMQPLLTWTCSDAKALPAFFCSFLLYPPQTFPPINLAHVKSHSGICFLKERN